MTDTLAARVHRIKPSPTIAVSTRAQELKASGRDVINLGSGEPDFDTPQHIKDAAARAMKDGMTKYTAVGGTAALKESVCKKFAEENALQYSPPQIIVSTGAKHCIMNLMLAVCDDGDEVVIPAPYWVSYPDMALLADARPVFVAADAAQGYKITAAQLHSALSDKSKLLILNSPSNPSGALYSKDELAQLAEVLQKFPRVIVASDDIYEHIRYDGRPFSTIANAAVDAPDLMRRIVSINGVSKAFAMTGWRIGYAAGDAVIIKAMTKIQSQATSNPCSIAQAAAAAALDGGTECLRPMLAAFERRRKLVQDGFNAMNGLSCGDIEGAFYAFIDAGAAIEKLHADGKIAEANDLAFCGYLLDHANVAAVPGSAFGCDNHFRISFAAADSWLEKSLQRISDAVQ